MDGPLQGGILHGCRFMKHVAMLPVALACGFLPAGAAASEPAVPRPVTDLRASFFAVAGGRASNLVVATERAIGLPLVFAALPDDDPVVARFVFDPHRNEPRVLLRKDWQDVDVAHEVMHARMDLVDRFCVLAWRRNVAQAPEVEAAFARLQTYVKDEVVHARLLAAGFKLDGEIFRPPLFDSIYENAARHLEEGRDRPHDGMAHLDKLGQGNLCRVCFLVQAELLLLNHRGQLPARRIAQTERFIRAFRAHRVFEASRADTVLALFRRHDVAAPAGHRRLLEAWAALEGLEAFVGASSYLRAEGGGIILPFPES